jgi:hypothetical protein
MKQRCCIFIASVSAGALYALWYFPARNQIIAGDEPTILKEISQEDMNNYHGQITTNAQRENVYTSSKYGLSFTYPKEWDVSQNNLGYGALQITNYDISTSDGRSFRPGQNKLEAAIVTTSTVSSSPDFPDEKQRSTQVTLAGVTATRTEVFLSEGVEFLNYHIPLPSLQGQYLTISIFGDTSNFSILDRIMRSIEFSK